MGKNKVLVKVKSEGKYVVDIDADIDVSTLSLRVPAVRLFLPNKVAPLVRVKKVPDSTYEMAGGLGMQIKLIKAAARHTDCEFIGVSGSELVQKDIGEGSRMVPKLSVMAREHAPSIIFMDEIDSIGSSRGESGNGGRDSEV